MANATAALRATNQLFRLNRSVGVQRSSQRSFADPQAVTRRLLFASSSWTLSPSGSDTLSEPEVDAVESDMNRAHGGAVEPESSSGGGSIGGGDGASIGMPMAARNMVGHLRLHWGPLTLDLAHFWIGVIQPRL